MHPVRSIGKFLRGKTTPGQLSLAMVFGSMLGFLPAFFVPSTAGGGFAQAPGLILAVIGLVLVLNINVLAVVVVAVLVKPLSLLLLPASFHVGRWLIDGPLQPLFHFLVNAPVTAWFGLEYYATTGGLVLGAVLGLVLSIPARRILADLNRRCAASAEGQDVGAIQRSLTWLLLGPTKGLQGGSPALVERHRRAFVIRPSGIVLVLISVSCMFLFQRWLSTPLLTHGLRSGLTVVNGATVDLESAEIDFTSGALRITNLAIADTADLTHDSFAATSLEASLDTTALLSRRFVIDTLRADGASMGMERQTPGVLTQPLPEPPPPPTGRMTIEDYIREVKLWRARIEQIRKWLDYFASDEDEPDQQTVEEKQRELEKQIEQYGLARVTADHLREEWPLVWIRSIAIERVPCAWLDGDVLNFNGSDVSSEPWLVSSPVKLDIATTTDKFKFDLEGRSNNRSLASLDFALRHLTIDRVFRRLKIRGQPPLRGGTLDVTIQGELLRDKGRMAVDLPVQVELHDTVFALGNLPPTPVEHLVLPIGVHGRADNPTISLNDRALTQALVAAGKQRLANFVREQGGALLGSVPGADKLLESGETINQLLQGGDKAKEAKKKVIDGAKERAKSELEKRLPGIRGILPGGK